MLETELTRPKALLVTDWAKSLFDGAITPETDGFIDDDCMPPWDCWVDICNIEEAYGDLCLISWVPPLLAEKVDRGIFIDAAECMSWLVVDSMGIISLNGWGKQWTTSS
ncbi:hypothetical protein KFU94_60930 [Chloroflexi bacterium TSY]|nr:hypothetical protein [Chloroflexi bacterium TSY]